MLYTFTGPVIRGNQIGRTIGFPTANLHVDADKVHLSNGVYGVKVTYNKTTFIGVMNVGVRPTINHEEDIVHYEVHIFDFNEMIYDKTLQIETCFFVRKEISFSSLDQLISQIKNDIELVKGRLQAGSKSNDQSKLVGGMV